MLPARSALQSAAGRGAPSHLRARVQRTSGADRGLCDCVCRPSGAASAPPEAARHAIDAPIFASGDLKDKNVVIVPMQIEAARGAPAGVGVDLHVLAEEAFEAGGQLFERVVEFVNSVEHE